MHHVQMGVAHQTSAINRSDLNLMDLRNEFASWAVSGTSTTEIGQRFSKATSYSPDELTANSSASLWTIASNTTNSHYRLSEFTWQNSAVRLPKCSCTADTQSLVWNPCHHMNVQCFFFAVLFTNLIYFNLKNCNRLVFQDSCPPQQTCDAVD